MASPTSYQIAVDNSNALVAILINRTPYAAYFSLGSLIASAEAQAQFSNAAVGLTARQNAWNLSISLLQSATSLANDLCRPSTYVWKTAFNVQEMRDLLNTAPPGPNYTNWEAWKFTKNAPAYLRDRLTEIRGHLGSIVANPSTLETGVHGQGCIK